MNVTIASLREKTLLRIQRLHFINLRPERQVRPSVTIISRPIFVNSRFPEDRISGLQLPGIRVRFLQCNSLIIRQETRTRNAET